MEDPKKTELRQYLRKLLDISTAEQSENRNLERHLENILAIMGKK